MVKLRGQTNIMHTMRYVGAIRILSVLIAVFSILSSYKLVSALTTPQQPATASAITIIATGLAPFDVTTYDQGFGTNQGTDANASNNIIRNFDLITYSVETSVNDADDTNILSTVTLNDKAR